MPLLTVTNLSKTFDEEPVVNHVSFEFEHGKTIALIGPNGSGKTTILRMLAGLLRPTTGTVQFNNRQSHEDYRSFIGYLPQCPIFYSWMSGQEFLTYCGELTLMPTDEANEVADRLLDKVGLYEVKDKRISTYSNGMKQRLGIAQAIIHQPKLLLLDEPVASLDPMGRREVLTLLGALKKEMTILFSTHLLMDAVQISDELLLLNKGCIVESGSKNELSAKYQTATIELEFYNNLEGYERKVQQLPSITNSYIKKNTLHVTTSNVTRAREEIFEAALHENWSLTHFTILPTSLEDLFMKGVTVT
ncbi:MAG TPA: ABC transporter ATP-binding protein [Bacillota bacterium]